MSCVLPDKQFCNAKGVLLFPKDTRCEVNAPFCRGGGGGGGGGEERGKAAIMIMITFKGTVRDF